MNHAAEPRPERDLIAGVTTEVIPDVGHMLPVEQPALFARQVLDFIRDVDRQVHTA